MEAEWHVMKQWMGQLWDQGRNQKVLWSKWKWGHNNPKSVGHWESNCKVAVHSIIGLPQKTRKSSNKQSNFTLKGTWKNSQVQSEYKEGNNKDQNRNKWNRV